jgi:sucrose-6-phosphate hydrolase
VIFHENTKNYKSKINSPTFINLSNIKSREFTLKIYYDTQKDTGFSITYKNNLFEIKRDMFNIINENQGITRTIEIYNLDIVDIFIDNSSIEIFINNGVYTMTSRVFPIESENTIIYESDIEIDLLIQQLNSCIENNFVL